MPLDALDNVSQKLNGSASQVAELRSRIQTGIQNAFGPLGGPAFGSRLDEQLGRAQQALSSISSGIQKASTGLRNTAKTYRDTDQNIADGFRKPPDLKPDLPTPTPGKPSAPGGPTPGKPTGKPDLPGGSTSPSGAGGTPKSKPDLKPDAPSGPGGPNGSPTPPTPSVPTPTPSAPTAPSGSPNKPSAPRADAVGKDDLTTKSDPVDVASGKVILEQVDVELPAPLKLERLHVSSYRAGLWFGPSWTSTVDQRLELDAEDVCYFSPDGMILVYPRAAAGVPTLPVEGPRWPLTLAGDGSYTLAARDRDLRFGPLPGRGRAVLPLLTIADRGGDRVDVEYDELGAPVVLRHSGGYRVGLRTDAGRVTELRVLEPGQDTGVLVTRFGYDQQGRLTQVIDSSGAPQVFDYDQDGRITGWQDRNGHWYRYVYDADGRCVRTVGDQGYLDSTFAYDREARVTTFTDALGHTTEFHLNEANQVVREVDPLGNTTVSNWDRYDRLLSRIDPLGRTTSYEYTVDGEVAAVVRPDGSRVGVDRRDDGATAISTAAGERVYPAGTAPDVFTEQIGVATAFHPSRQLGTEAPPPGVPVERDLFGRPRVVADAAGARTHLGWTVEGRQASRVGPLGRREEWRYDAEGNPVEHAGAPGRVTRYEYGPLDLPVASVDPAGARTTYEYDAELRLTRITNPAGLTWHYYYDAAGRRIAETDFDGRVLRFDYDAAGQLVRSVNGMGDVTTYAYDALGNLVERRTPAGVTTYAYDPAGMLVHATDPESVLEIERDEHGRVVRETVNGRGVTYAYGANSMRRHTPSGVDSSWSFDAEGTPETLTVAGQVVTFRHDHAGREIERTTGGGAVLTQSFDAEHQLTGQTVTANNRTVQQRRYQYHVDGQLTGVDDAISGPVRFRLDQAGRVTGVAAPDGGENYGYDPSGNIVHAQHPAAGPELGPRHYTGNALAAAGAVRYAYDQQGRLTARQETAARERTWTYSWDPLDRLVGVRTPDGAIWRYRYDPLGRRIAKQRLVPNGPTSPAVAEEVEFVWSGQLLVEQIHRTQHGQQLVTTWDHHPGSTRPVTQTEHLGSSVRFFSLLTDQVGTPVDLIDTNGVVAWHGSTSLWGKPKPPHAGSAWTPLRFPGQYADDETGLHYNVFRYYDPGTGRYLSQDPLGLAPAPNPVAYVPNPLLDADPLGLGNICGKESKNPPEAGARPVPQATPGGGHNAGGVQSTNPTASVPPQARPTPSAPPAPPPPPSSAPPPPPPPSAPTAKPTPPKPGPSLEDQLADKKSNLSKVPEGQQPKPPEDRPDTPDAPDKGPKAALDSKEFDDKVNETKEKLKIDGPVKILSIPEKLPDGRPVTLSTPVSELPGSGAYGLTGADKNKLVGEILGGFPRDEILKDPDTANFLAKDSLKHEGGGSYNSESKVIVSGPDPTEKTIFHEMGHIKQHEQGGFTLQNTNKYILEYDNILRSENSLGGGMRDNYTHEPNQASGRSWSDFVSDATSADNPQQKNNKVMLANIEEVLGGQQYQGNADRIRQNLVDEYFHNKPKS